MHIGYIVNNKYKVLCILGAGGISDIYKVRSLSSNSIFTLKILRLDYKENLYEIKRFQKEAQVLTKLDNPNIIKIYDYGNDHGIPYLIMEYIDGMDLKMYLCKNYPIDLSMVVHIMEQILLGVGYAHEKGIIHRDLKSKNILIDNENHIKVTDFDISIMTLDSTLTKTKSMIGSVHYISPEQVKGSVITKKSDIYSLGIILFELLTNRLPFNGDNTVSIAIKHCYDILPSVRSINPNIPQSLENIILHSTAKDPYDRYSSVDEMLLDLQTSLSHERINEDKWISGSIDNDDTKYISIVKKKYIKENNHFISLKNKNLFVKLMIFCIIFLILVFIIYVNFYRVKVPDLSGMDIDEAEQILFNKKLILGSKKYTYNNNYYKGQIIRSIPSDGDIIRHHDKVNILISKGPQKVKFGSYIGKNYQKVKEQLTKRGAIVTSMPIYSPKYSRGKIVNQNINYNSFVSLKQLEVTFFVSKGIKSWKIPNLIGQTQQKVENYSLNHNITVIFEQEHSKVVHKGIVISQMPSPGSIIKSGSQIIIKLSIGS